MWCSICNFIFWIVSLVVLILLLGWWMNGHFRRRGIEGPPAYLPFIGNMLPALRQTIHVKDFIEEIYSNYSKERYVGIMQFHKPQLILRDVEIIKQVTISEFDHFVDHLGVLDETVDVLFGNSLICLKGQKWHDMRVTLSPAFTSSKMRGMFQFVVDCGEQMVEYYRQQMNSSENMVRGIIELEMKDAFTRYTNDIIATTAFGVTVDSFADKNNQFYLTGKETTDVSGLKALKAIFLQQFPKIAKTLDIRFITEKQCNFFRNLVWDTVKYREENKVVRHDMIHLLIEARKGTLKHDFQEDSKEAEFATVQEFSVGKTALKRVWTDDEIVAQALIFFIAGYETSSTLLCFLIHELALQPEIQRKLQQEIDEMASSTDGKLTYETLQKMKYLDMVVSETLRKWPPNVLLDRKCTKSFVLPPPNDKSDKEYQINVGDGLWIPLYGLHHDPKYFDNPRVFDPERFSEQNKQKIVPGSYIPFGIGPRNCIGSRFALMEVKSIIYNLLLHFDLVTTAKTQHPIKMKTNSFNMTAEKGFWIGLKPRNIQR